MMKELGEEYKSSLVLNLFENGFSFDDKDTFYNHLKSNAAISDAVNYLLLPGQLEHLLQKTHQVRLQKKKMEEAEGKVSQPDLKTLSYYDGGILLDVRDYREGRGYFSETQDFMVPHSFTVYLKRDAHSLLLELSAPSHSTKDDKLYIEKHLLNEMYPTLFLEPSLDYHHILTTLHYSNNKFLVPIKSRISKKQKSIKPIRVPRYQRCLNVRNDVTLPQKSSKLLNHLKSMNFVGEYQKEIPYHLQQGRRPKESYNAPNIPNSKVISFQSPLIGRFLFASPLRHHHPQMPSTNEHMDPSEMMTIETKGAGPQSPFEIYHLILKVSSTSKPLHLPLGGPQTTQSFLNQFKKLEKPATKEQLHLYNEYLRSQLQPQNFTANPMQPGPPSNQPMISPNQPPPSTHIPMHTHSSMTPQQMQGGRQMPMNTSQEIKSPPYGHQRIHMTQRMMPTGMGHTMRNPPPPGNNINMNTNMHRGQYQVHPGMVGMPYSQNTTHHTDVSGMRNYGYPPPNV